MEVWNGIWKKILVWNGIWSGRFLVWNGNEMEENCQNGIRKNRLPFHSIPCPAFRTKTLHLLWVIRLNWLAKIELRGPGAPSLQYCC